MSPELVLSIVEIIIFMVGGLVGYGRLSAQVQENKLNTDQKFDEVRKDIRELRNWIWPRK